MKKKYIKITSFFGVLSLLSLGVIFATEFKAETPDFPSLWQNIFISILCSVIASFLFSLLQAAMGQDAKEEIASVVQKVDDVNNALSGKVDQVNRALGREIEEIEQALGNVNDNLRIQSELYDSGIVSIRKKSYYDPNGQFWNKIIDSTTEKLDLIGHSISKWFDDEFKSTFVKKINDMLTDQKKVRIILSGKKPDINKIHQAEQKNGEDVRLTKIEKTCYELRQIILNIPKELRGNLQVYITNPSQVTYMYIRTDHQCFISPYISSVTNSANAFLLELDTRVEYSKCFERDFEEMTSYNLNRINLEK